MAKALTDRKLKALERKPAEPGKTYDIVDGLVPGLAVRVTPTGRRSFVLVGRFPGRRSFGGDSSDQGRTSRCYAGAPFRFRLRKERQFFSEVRLPTR